MINIEFINVSLSRSNTNQFTYEMNETRITRASKNPSSPKYIFVLPIELWQLVEKYLKILDISMLSLINRNCSRIFHRQYDITDIKQGCTLYMLTIEASQSDYREIIYWLFENNHYFDIASLIIFAERGDLEMLKLIVNKNKNYNAIICHKAVKYGHLDIVKWIKEIGYMTVSAVSDVCSDALKYSQLHILKWLYENYRVMDIGDSYRAAIIGNTEVLEWFKEINCPFSGLIHHTIVPETTRQFMRENKELFVNPFRVDPIWF